LVSYRLSLGEQGSRNSGRRPGMPNGPERARITF